MENRYSRAFAKLRQKNGKAFIPFTMLGWPTPDECLETIKLMIDEGATALELGVAFSDPVADGPVIHAAAFQTLDNGFTLDKALHLVSQVRAYNREVPIGILIYFNVVLAQGVDNFYRKAAESGIDSVLIADLPPDSADEITGPAKAHSVEPVFIVSPLTDKDRLQRIASLGNAYVYVVSRLGITGTQERHDTDLGELLSRARAVTSVPLCVGFGVSSAQAAKGMIEKGADGVITGSKIVDIISSDDNNGYPKLRQFLREMVAVTSGHEQGSEPVSPTAGRSYDN